MLQWPGLYVVIGIADIFDTHSSLALFVLKSALNFFLEGLGAEHRADHVETDEDWLRIVYVVIPAGGLVVVSAKGAVRSIRDVELSRVDPVHEPAEARIVNAWGIWRVLLVIGAFENYKYFLRKVYIKIIIEDAANLTYKAFVDVVGKGWAPDAEGNNWLWETFGYR